MGQIKAIRIETGFEKEMKRLEKEKCDFLVAQTTCEKNKQELRTDKWTLYLSILSIIIQLFK